MFVTNCISTTKIQKISEITNFFRHYFLSRTEVDYYKTWSALDNKCLTFACKDLAPLPEPHHRPVSYL